jgi:NADH-quinone oxidoreductase subunit G
MCYCRTREEVLAAKKANEPAPYDFIEVMACRGGCIAGGGQPYGTDDQIRKQRIAGLYNDDEQSTYRKSHDNPSIKKIYSDYLGQPMSHKAHSLLHTSYTKRKQYNA